MGPQPKPAKSELIPGRVHTHSRTSLPVATIDEPFFAPSAELRDPNRRVPGESKGAATMPPPPTDWIDWLRGLDLNQRPLGYEATFSVKSAQLNPSKS